MGVAIRFKRWFKSKEDYDPLKSKWKNSIQPGSYFSDWTSPQNISPPYSPLVCFNPNELGLTNRSNGVIMSLTS